MRRQHISTLFSPQPPFTYNQLACRLECKACCLRLSIGLGMDVSIATTSGNGWFTPSSSYPTDVIAVAVTAAHGSHIVFVSLHRNVWG